MAEATRFFSSALLSAYLLLLLDVSRHVQSAPLAEAAQEVESSLADSAAASQAAANAPVETSVTATTVAGKTNDDDTDLRMDLTGMLLRVS
ncbi:hypothetical protein AAVH_41481 [Aphelenchoides avenae]|nr:hypothetical protein AAVH_41481 [Aphelenchus avenae]